MKYKWLFPHREKENKTFLSIHSFQAPSVVLWHRTDSGSAAETRHPAADNTHRYWDAFAKSKTNSQSGLLGKRKRTTTECRDRTGLFTAGTPAPALPPRPGPLIRKHLLDSKFCWLYEPGRLYVCFYDKELDYEKWDVVITAACTPMAEAREAGRRLKKIWCLLSERGRNTEDADGLWGPSREGSFEGPPPKYKSKTLSSFFFFLI